MILSVCLNPCIDRYYYIDKLLPRALNRAARVTESLGGKGINVAVAVARLSKASAASGFLFAREADLFLEKLELENVSGDFTRISGSTRRNVKVIERGGALTEISQSGSKVSPSALSKLKRKLTVLSEKADAVVFSGSLPAGLPPDSYAYLADGIKAPVIVDAAGEVLLASLKCRPALIKPNESELSAVTGINCESAENIIKASEKLCALGAKSVLCSRGGGGAIYFDGVKAHSTVDPKIKVISSVGAGDSMLASAAVALVSGASKQQILMRAVAAGSAACLTEGTGLFTYSGYQKMLGMMGGEKELNGDL